MRETKSYILNVNKPAGITSASVVAQIKRILGGAKVGHLGTLDSLGCGVLPIAVNKATRIFAFAEHKQKSYRAIFKFGIETDTLDSAGSITQKSHKIITEQDLKHAAKKFVGTQMQMPPNFSAKKINGVRASDLMRKNIEVEIKPKAVRIDKIEVVKQFEENTFLVEVDCGEGTYIRSLCRDLARQMGTCGVMVGICRTRCGICDISNAVTIDDVKNGVFNKIEISQMLDLPQKHISNSLCNDLLCGKKVRFEAESAGKFLLFSGSVLLGVYHCDDGYLKCDAFLRSE